MNILKKICKDSQLFEKLFGFYCKKILKKFFEKIKNKFFEKLKIIVDICFCIRYTEQVVKQRNDMR